MFRESIEVAAEPAALFELSQDYDRRLDWDPFLREARLLDGATRAGEGVRAWCASRLGTGMETRYVSFHPPGACAVEMTRGPWFLQNFAGSWRFEPIAPGRTRVVFSYNLVARPRWLAPLLQAVFARESRRRLRAFGDFAELRSG